VFDKNEPTDPNPIAPQQRDAPTPDPHPSVEDAQSYDSLWQTNQRSETSAPPIAEAAPPPPEPLLPPERPEAVVIPRVDPPLAPSRDADAEGRNTFPRPNSFAAPSEVKPPSEVAARNEATPPNEVTLRIPASAPRFEPDPAFGGLVGSPPPPSPWQAPTTAAPAPTPMLPPAQQAIAAPVMPAAPPVMFSPPSAAPQAPAKKAKKKRSVGKWLTGAVAALAILAGGFFLGSGLRESDTAESAVDTAEPAVGEVEAEVVEPTVAVEDVPVSVEVQAAPVPEPVVAVAARVAESVVRIDVAGGLGQGGLGSGIVYSEDGYIVTNAHVVGQATDVLITLSNGFLVPGVVIGADAETDVAVVQVATDADLVPAVFAAPESIRVGQLAVAIGSPFGLSQTVTAGIVSSDRRPVRGTQIPDQNTAVPMIQTDAPINPGNSGGALVDAQGQIIGMNTLIRTDGESNGNIGVGFAIASDIVAKVADGIIAGEPVQPSVLGVTGSDQDIGVQPGAVIGTIALESAAAEAGLLIGDRVVMFDGVEIQSMDDLAATVRLSDAGVPLGLTVVRDGELIELMVALNTRGG